MKITSAVVLVLFSLAQGPYRSGVELVSLPVTVTDPAGRVISGLTLHDFAVDEDGVAQTLTMFSDAVRVR